MSSTYHPQSNGQTEVVNKSLEHYLRSFSTNDPTKWAKWLYLAKFWFNTNYHTTTKMTPYEAQYGFSPPRLPDYVPGTTQVTIVDSILHSRQQILTLLKQNLVDAQTRMKRQSDLHKTQRVVKAGDWVYLRLQPYKQESNAYRGSNKLFPQFFRTYKVLKRIGKMAYKLDLPAESTIHPMFHMSCLNHNISISMLPSVNSQGILTPKPAAVLQSMSHQLQRRTIIQLLIQWQGGSIEDAT